MKIAVWKSEHTGELFEREVDYKNHMRRVRAETVRQGKRNAELATIQQWLDEEKANLTNISMITEWFLTNQKDLMRMYMIVNPNTWDKFYPETDEYTKFKIEATYSPTVSNSHHCPNGGVTNWCGRVEGAPRSYPGFSGRVDGVLKRKKDTGRYPTSDFLEWVGIKTGTGGGGNERWGYGAEIFLGDWPGLAHQGTIDILKGTK